MQKKVQNILRFWPLYLMFLPCLAYLLINCYAPMTGIVLGTVLAIAVAIILNEIRNKAAKQAYQTVILIPYLIPWWWSATLPSPF